MPGLSISVDQMLKALETVGGTKALSLVEEEIDEGIERIVKGWPSKLDASKAEALGCRKDESFEMMLKEYIEDYLDN